MGSENPVIFRKRRFFDSVGLGFSFEWHDFTAAAELDWARSFHPGSVELCLNLEGQATVPDARQVAELRPRSVPSVTCGKLRAFSLYMANSKSRGNGQFEQSVAVGFPIIMV